MTNSTDTFWEADGKSLQTYAYNIQSWGGDRETPPALRGGNIIVPGAPGQVFVPKTPDSRVMTLGMWVQGCTEDGFAPTSGNRRAEFERNWRALKKLLWTPRREISLVKRFRQDGESAVTVARAKAQYSSGLSPSMTGTQRAIFTVDLFLSDPYFYGDEVTLQTLVTNQQTITFEALGDERTRDISVAIAGARVNPKLTVTGPDAKERWMKYTYALGASDSASIDVRNFSSRTVPGGGAAFGSSGLITASSADDPNWLGIDPGTNKLKLESTSGTGNVVVKYKPVYL